MITPSMIHAAASDGYSGWTRKQLSILGVAWPPPKGWLKLMKNSVITKERWDRFVAAKNRKLTKPEVEETPTPKGI